MSEPQSTGYGDSPDTTDPDGAGLDENGNGTSLTTDEAAQKAIEKLHQHQMDGRAIVVNEAQPKPAGGSRPFGGGGGGFNRGGGGRGGDDYGGGSGRRGYR